MKPTLPILLALSLLLTLPAKAQDTLVYSSGSTFEVFIVRETGNSLIIKRNRDEPETVEVPFRALTAIYYEDGRQRIFPKKEVKEQPVVKKQKETVREVTVVREVKAARETKTVREVEQEDYRAWINRKPGEAPGNTKRYLLHRVSRERIYLVPVMQEDKTDPVLIPVAFKNINTLYLRKRGQKGLIIGSMTAGGALLGAGVGLVVSGIEGGFGWAPTRYNSDVESGSNMSGYTLAGAALGFGIGFAVLPTVKISINRVHAPDEVLLNRIKRYAREY